MIRLPFMINQIRILAMEEEKYSIVKLDLVFLAFGFFFLFL